jgi:hypothetical protein
MILVAKTYLFIITFLIAAVLHFSQKEETQAKSITKHNNRRKIA